MYIISTNYFTIILCVNTQNTMYIYRDIDGTAAVETALERLNLPRYVKSYNKCKITVPSMSYNTTLRT